MLSISGTKNEYTFMKKHNKLYKCLYTFQSEDVLVVLHIYVYILYIYIYIHRIFLERI